MKGILSALKWFIDIIKLLFNTLMNIFKILGKVFQILFQIVNIAFTTILSMPTWLQAFMVITIIVSVMYVVLGRESGKSD